MTDPKPLTPEELRKIKGGLDGLDHEGWVWQLIATIEAAWSEAQDNYETMLEWKKRFEEERRRTETAEYLASSIGLGHGTAEEIQDSIKSWATRILGARWVRLRRRLLKVLWTARVERAERKKAEAEVAALRQAVEAAKGLNILHDEQVRRLEQERDEAEAEVTALKKMVERAKSGEYVMEAVLAKQDAKDAEEAKAIAINVSNAFDAARLETIRGLRAKLTATEQERDKALADGARMREYASVFMSALGKISMCNRANGRCLSYPATCLGCRVTEFLFETPNDWLKRHDAEVLKGAADWLEAEGDYILLQCGKNHKYPENPGCCHAHLRECFAQALRERAAEERKA